LTAISVFSVVCFFRPFSSLPPPSGNIRDNRLSFFFFFPRQLIPPSPFSRGASRFSPFLAEEIETFPSQTCTLRTFLSLSLFHDKRRPAYFFPFLAFLGFYFQEGRGVFIVLPFLPPPLYEVILQALSSFFTPNTNPSPLLYRLDVEGAPFPFFSIHQI